MSADISRKQTPSWDPHSPFLRLPFQPFKEKRSWGLRLDYSRRAGAHQGHWTDSHKWKRAQQRHRWSQGPPLSGTFLVWLLWFLSDKCMYTSAPSQQVHRCGFNLKTKEPLVKRQGRDCSGRQGGHRTPAVRVGMERLEDSILNSP